MNAEVILGSQVTDPITGFTGTATARAEYLDTRVLVLVEARNPGEVKERWIMETRLVAADSIPAPGAYA